MYRYELVGMVFEIKKRWNFLDQSQKEFLTNIESKLYYDFSITSAEEARIKLMFLKSGKATV